MPQPPTGGPPRTVVAPGLDRSSLADEVEYRRLIVRLPAAAR